MSSWGIGWFPSIERLNSRHRSIQCKKNESNRFQNDESKQEREGWEQEREELKRDSQKHLTNRIPEDKRRLRPPFPLQNLSAYTNSWICGPLPHKNPKGRGNKAEMNENGGGEGDEGLPLLIYRAYYIFPICPWIFMSELASHRGILVQLVIT